MAVHSTRHLKDLEILPEGVPGLEARRMATVRTVIYITDSTE